LRRAAALSALALVAAGCGGPPVEHYEIRSRFVHRTLPQTAMVPPDGGSGRPLLVFLHGRGEDGEESNANDEFRAALEALGDDAPVVVFPNGGESSYWHRRAGGDWGRYVLDEVVPEAVRRFHADPDRVAIGGISMGGFGAFAVARLAPERFCAVGGHSAAMWFQGADTPAGAFDDAADFARNDLVADAQLHGREPWGTAQLWLDGGTKDPFRSADEALAKGLGIRMRVWPGEHSGDYWHAHYDDYLRFYSRALRDCNG
jgi:S-formylglutathione hydrolase FrmB